MYGKTHVVGAMESEGLILQPPVSSVQLFNSTMRQMYGKTHVVGAMERSGVGAVLFRGNRI